MGDLQNCFDPSLVLSALVVSVLLSSTAPPHHHRASCDYVNYLPVMIWGCLACQRPTTFFHPKRSTVSVFLPRFDPPRAIVSPPSRTLFSICRWRQLSSQHFSQAFSWKRWASRCVYFIPEKALLVFVLASVLKSLILNIHNKKINTVISKIFTRLFPIQTWSQPFHQVNKTVLDPITP